jgi:hypothetical protein
MVVLVAGSASELCPQVIGLMPGGLRGGLGANSASGAKAQSVRKKR